MRLSLNTDEENKNWSENNCNRINLKDAKTKADTNTKEEEDSKTVLSDLTFTVAAAPAQVKFHNTPATSAIPEHHTIKGIFDDLGAWMKVSATATKSDIDTVTIVIPKYQVAMLDKKGANIVDQVGKSYLTNALIIPGRM